MEALMSALMEQNERMLDSLSSIDDKLDALSDIKFAVESLNDRVEAIEKELRWYEDLSFGQQLIKAVDGVTSAVESNG